MNIIFDESGSVYEVEEMEAMARDMTPEEMEEIYKSTSYWYLYTQYLYNLIDEGKVNIEKKFGLSQVSDSIDIIGNRLEEVLGTETRKQWDAQVTEQWEQNKNS